MRQKTLLHYYGLEEAKLKIGDKGVLVEKTNENTGNSWFEFWPGYENGIGGVLDSNQTRFHGWRGTAYGTACFAHGYREVIKAVDKDNGLQKITVGKDLKPKEA